VGNAFDRAVSIVAAHRPVHEKAAQQLLQKETLDEGDLEALRMQISPLPETKGSAENAAATRARPLAFLK